MGSLYAEVTTRCHIFYWMSFLILHHVCNIGVWGRNIELRLIWIKFGEQRSHNNTERHVSAVHHSQPAGRPIRSQQNDLLSPHKKKKLKEQHYPVNKSLFINASIIMSPEQASLTSTNSQSVSANSAGRFLISPPVVKRQASLQEKRKTRTRRSFSHYVGFIPLL